MSTNQRDKIGVVGLGKLGLPLACVLAMKGHPVVGVDVAEESVEALRGGEYRGHEPRVAELLTAHHGEITLTTDLRALQETWAAFVVVPTPSNSVGRFSLKHVLPAVRGIAHAAAGRRGPYIIVLVSTVMPGACQREVQPAISTAAGKQAANISLVYAPEFIALGDVVRGMLRPDLILLGCDNPLVAERIEKLWLSIVETKPRLVSTSFTGAELAKLGLNALLAFKVTSANLLAQLCQRFPDVNVDSVTAAIGADSRIGDRYLRGGLGYGGPCLPRDVRALSVLCREQGVDADIPDAITRFNDGLPSHVVDLVFRSSPANGRVGVLGLAYRPGTPITDGSHGVAIARLLAAFGTNVFVHDALVRPDDVPELAGPTVQWCADAPQLVASVDTVVIATADGTLVQSVARQLSERRVIDCWRTLNPRQLENLSQVGGRSRTGRYVALGCGQPEQTEVSLAVKARTKGRSKRSQQPLHVFVAADGQKEG